MKNIILCTGGFDPIHSGHIQYLKRSKSLGDILYVGVNSDEWLTRKKGRPFMPLQERLSIIQELNFVDYTIKFNDDDDSARNAIKMVREMHPNDRIIFSNGGDRTQENIPEMDVNNNLRYEKVEFVFGVGGSNKINSSSWLLEEWKSPKVERPWGHYRVIYENDKTKVKELIVNPKSSLSMQKHEFRNEYWHVVEGVATITLEYPRNEIQYKQLFKHHHITIPIGLWHQLRNEENDELKIIEIQYGEKCEEEDIDRRLTMEMPGTIGSAKIVFGDK